MAPSRDTLEQQHSGPVIGAVSVLRKLHFSKTPSSAGIKGLHQHGAACVLGCKKSNAPFVDTLEQLQSVLSTPGGAAN